MDVFIMKMIATLLVMLQVILTHKHARYNLTSADRIYGDPKSSIVLTI